MFFKNASILNSFICFYRSLRYFLKQRCPSMAIILKYCTHELFIYALCSWHSLFTGLLEEFAKCEISVSHPPFLEKVREKKTAFMRLIFISSSKGESKICILKSILEMKLAYKMCQYHFRTRNAKKVINNLICFIYL